MTAVPGPVNLWGQCAFQAENHLGAGLFQEPAGTQGVGEEAAGLAGPHRHRHITHLRAQGGPGGLCGIAPVNRHLVARRGQPPGQVLHGGLGPAGATHPLPQHGDFHRFPVVPTSRPGEYDINSSKKSKFQGY